MGMFDYVEYEAKCENCGADLNDFQSKDSKCLLDTVQPKDVDEFYTNCSKCGTWHDFLVERECAVKCITVKASEGYKDD